jgi:hypothetical protein
MDLVILKNKLIKDDVSINDIDYIMDYISTNINSMIYVNEDLLRLEFLIVLKNSGGIKIFKTLDKNIIVDKLDKAYSVSRELVALPRWDFDKCYLVKFDGIDLVSSNLDFKDMVKVLYSLVEPIYRKYVVGINGLINPYVIRVNNDLYKGLSYSEYKKCVVGFGLIFDLPYMFETSLFFLSKNYKIFSYFYKKFRYFL